MFVLAKTSPWPSLARFRSSGCARSASRNWDWKNRLQR